MSDMRCPVCGKSNPSDLEFCQKCHARLKLVVDPFSIEDENAGPPDPFPLYEATDAEKTSDSDEKLPDWLQSEYQDDEEPFSQVSTDETLPDWLAVEESSSRVETPHDDTKDTDWLSAGELDGEEVPEWLSSLGSDMDADLVSRQSEAPGDTALEDDEEPPEWLSRVRARKQAGEGEQIQQLDSEEISDIFDEADSTGGVQENIYAEVSEEVEPFDTGGDELPDWLPIPDEVVVKPELEDQIIQSESIDDIPVEGTTTPDTEIPAWVSELRGAEVESDLEPAEDQADVDLPEWLAEGGSIVEVPPSDEEQEDIPRWVAGLAGVGAVVAGSEAGEEPEVEGVQDWEIELDEAFTPDDDIASQTVEEVQEVDFEQPGELQTVETLVDSGDAIPVQEEELVAPFTLEEDEDLFGTEVAEWLSEIPTQDALEVDTPEQDEGIEPAELPIWLAAMRPIEAIAPETQLQDEREQQVERSGPLAGLSGILPAEPAIARVKKTSAYAIKLRVSDSQQTHAGMLEELIKNEGDVVPVPEKAGISSQHVLRLSIFILLLLAMLWPLMTGRQEFPLPGLAAETLDASKTINTISDGAPVLLAVEYEPGLSAEMEATAASVVDHLMIKGAFLTLVSTSTMGPAQAERLVGVVNDYYGHDYQASSQYVNLGFIPGGPIGLLGFAGSPRLVLPFALDNSPTWEDGPLANVQELDDFGLVVVITESSDTARAWIEQVQPELEDTPLLMVISAQAEPLVRPYYAGSPQQVNGMVTGLAGGASYENSMNRPSIAHTYWDAFSIGLLVAAVLIALGGVVISTYTFLTRGNKAEGDTES